MRIKYTKEILTEIVAKSTSIAQVIRALGLREAGGNYCHIVQKIKNYNIDRSHFKKQTDWLHPGVNKKTWQEILIKKETGRRTCALQLRRALIESGRPYKCEGKDCKIAEWHGQDLILEVDHLNGDWLNNFPENLRFLCPNCHSQQKHKMNKGLTGITTLKSKRKAGVSQVVTKHPDTKHPDTKHPDPKPNYCLDCGKKISLRRKRCKSCAGKLQPTKILWPSYNDLTKMVEGTSFLAVGKKLGVSDNAVRKRLRNHKVA